MWSGVCEYPSQKDESSEMHYMLGKIKDKNASKYVKIKCSITTYHHHNIDHWEKCLPCHMPRVCQCVFLQIDIERVLTKHTGQEEEVSCPFDKILTADCCKLGEKNCPVLAGWTHFFAITSRSSVWNPSNMQILRQSWH